MNRICNTIENAEKEAQKGKMKNTKAQKMQKMWKCKDVKM